jgi:hypothetical protein
MNVQKLFAILISLAMTAGGYAARAAGDTKAEQLLAQARAALGGEKNLNKVQGLTATGTYQRTMQDRQLSGELTIDLQLPDKLLRTESMSPMGDMTIVTEQGLNGEKLLRKQRTLNGPPGMIVRMGRRADRATRKRRRSATRTRSWRAPRSPSSWRRRRRCRWSSAPAARPSPTRARPTSSTRRAAATSRPASSSIRKAHRPLMLMYRGVAPQRDDPATQQGPPPAGGRPAGRAVATTRHRRPAAPQVVDKSRCTSTRLQVQVGRCECCRTNGARSTIVRQADRRDAFKTIKINTGLKADIPSPRNKRRQVGRAGAGWPGRSGCRAGPSRTRPERVT